MGERRPNVTELADTLVSAFPKLDPVKRRVAIATYRRLALGRPVPVRDIGAEAGVVEAEVRRILGEWIGVFRDPEDRIVGFWGLAIPKMKHRFEVDGVALHTWCAWDTLFLPELLGRTARVESACETSGEPVRLTVSPAAIEGAEPSSPVMSFLAPEASRFQQDVIENFCHYVHFFRSREDGEKWVGRAPGTFLLTLDEAFEIARRKNRLQFGALLESAAERERP
ncbi:MAG: organomercurial lyase [Candidatus Binatia bacterium]